MKKIILASAALLIAGAAPAAADVLSDIKSRGTLVVGVKADYKPFGFRDPSGQIVGIEPDLAADLAKRLGVKLELVPVVASNRIEFVNQGKIDVVIATMSDKPERRKSVLAIDPQYYSDAVNVLMTQKAKFATWEDLKGRTLCATSGSFYNKEVESKYGVTIKAFDGSEKPLFALKQGECIGYLYDQTFVQGKLLDEEWKASYHMPLPGILETPWIMGVKTGEDAFAKFLSDTTKDWFKQGTIIEEEKKWGIQSTDYSKRMHEQAKGS
ncbi:transporter substrate-binding domain-containing protein [Chelatococcus sambhunathii]|uniref:Transporter substrate-binding domain-containing protein n=1 Tax=Chelatococcus sambhunathii TaxID=363953 RepID=A0ABU1DIE4_9HYPH|nr:transporter substrate-binding domain-containing protein [Chelatococcus sambhunathii]MDR4307904.1 transporter substrate-binding domain-containing protein [Chelatococcus sambhunathii]